MTRFAQAIENNAGMLYVAVLRDEPGTPSGTAIESVYCIDEPDGTIERTLRCALDGIMECESMSEPEELYDGLDVETGTAGQSRVIAQMDDAGIEMFSDSMGCRGRDWANRF